MSDSPIVVRFDKLGRETTLAKEWSIDSAYLVATDGFSFTLWDPNRDNLKDLEMQPVTLLVGGIPQVVGRIDKTSIGGDGTAIKCWGRDYIADMTECNVDPSLKVKRGQPLWEVVVRASSPVGIDTVIADDDLWLGRIRSGKKPPRGGSSKSRRSKRRGKPFVDFKPEAGQSIYDYLNKIVAREGATIQPGLDRTQVLISEPVYDQEALYTIRRSLDLRKGVNNNVESATADRDYSSFPTNVLMNGQQAIGGKRSANTKFEWDIWGLLNESSSELNRILLASTVSGRIRPDKPQAAVKEGALYRLLNHRDEIARDADQVKAAAKRAMAERLKETLQYRVTLTGHTDPQTGAIYSVDTMVNVDDDICDVHEKLWISERTLRYSESDGAKTDLVCWRPESFVLV